MTAPRPRRTIADIPAYVPGRPPAVVPGLAPYKLSSNENPFSPLPGVVAAATEAAARMNRYPDMGSSDLYAALARRFELSADRFAAATGSVALIFQLLQAYCDPGDEVVHAWRSFEAYPVALAAAGAVGVPVPLTDAEEHDLPAMAQAVTERTKVLLVCTPNNPTGTAVTATALAELLDAVPERVLVVVDEAYVEFVRMDDPVDGPALLKRHDNVVVLRTFSKAYGLAGLRVGFAIAHPEVAAALRAVALPFGVSAVAQAAAVASLAREPDLLTRVATLVEARGAVVGGLRDSGFTVPDAQGNFCWLRLGEHTDAFVAACGEAALSVRPFAGEGVRISIGEPEANQRLVEVAAAFGATG